MIGRDGLWHYSIPLYESIWDLIGFGILFWLYIGRHKSFDGFVFAAYGIYYGIGRTWIEAIRVDDVLYLGGMRVERIRKRFVYTPPALRLSLRT